MPIYEYQCGRCDAEFEEIVSGTEELPPCPSCGSAETRKLMSRACRCHGTGSGHDAPSYSGGGGGGCGGCAGGNCASCH